nr:MAG TPA: Protein of unknown function (DUF3090) [Crassvirales sp.]
MTIPHREENNATESLFIALLTVFCCLLICRLFRHVEFGNRVFYIQIHL